MKHKFIFHLNEAFPNVDYIQAIINRCTLDGSIVDRYKLDIDTRRTFKEMVMIVWTKKEQSR